MSYDEACFAGVCMAPIAPMLLLALLATLGLRHLADRAGLLRRVWHADLFVAALFICVLSLVVLTAAGRAAAGGGRAG